ncbi:AraC family transcriptional regulator [Paenibacillus sp. MBLB4367]|uniref:AraC family transcriptional regulator n=1 Tax=Paenibacillus sp. MBLB4367 TaxID=3384767 RepID=UPI003907F8F8
MKKKTGEAMTVYPKETYLESDAFPFACFPFQTMPEREPMPHAHDFIELVFVADGAGEHLYKGHAFPVSKGDIFVVPPYADHDYRVIGSSPMQVYNVLFLPSFLETELKVLSEVTPFVNFFYVEPFLRQNPDFESHMKLSLPEAREVKQRLDRVVTEFTQKALGYRISIKAQLIDLLVWLSRRYEERVVQTLFQRNEPIVIRQLCDFLEQHYAEPIRLDQVCQMCGMSQTRFTDKFKQTVGQTFTEYRNELRIHASLKLLRETDDKVIAIAGRVGIGDLSHFNKLFKKRIGLSPREYRNKYQESRP